MESQYKKSKNNQAARSKTSKKHNRKPKSKTEDTRPVLEVKSIERPNLTDPLGYESYKNQGLEKVISCMKAYKASLLKETSTRDKAREFSLLFNLISPAYIQMKYEYTSKALINKTEILNDKTENKTEVLNDKTEVLNDKTEVKSYNEEFPDYDDEDVLQTPDYSFMNDPNIVVGRVLLTRIRSKSQFNYPLSFQCNGVIIDSDTWDVLSIPPPAFNPNVKYAAVTTNLQKYNIYSILDGTTVTLYWYKKTSSWCFSTINGYDMGNMKWMGDKTYAELFNEVVSNYKGFSFDALEKDVCYSIGFRHPSMHPLITDPISAWLIKATKLITVNCGVKCETADNSLSLEPIKPIGIPVQMPISIETLGFVATSTGYTDAVGNAVDNRQIFQRLLNINSMALEHYVFSVSNKLPASIHYGFILRGEFPECKEYSHVMIESQLLKFIRLSIYNTPKVKANNLKITPENRIKYCVLRSYLNLGQRDVFIKIFPLYTKLYNIFNEIIESTVNKIWVICRKPNAKVVVATSTNSKNQMIDALATTFHNIIMKSENINVYDPNFKSIIRDYIERSCFTDLYYNMIYNSNF